MTEVASTSSHGFSSNSDVWSFQPSDESLAVDFLHPMATGFAVPDGIRIIADDPYHAEPWKLLAAHQRDVAEGAYFFTKKVMLSSKGLRRKRTVGEADKVVGTWRIQNSKNESNADRTPADKIVRWRKTLLSYYNAANSSTTTGYVMHEYELFKTGHGGDSGGRLNGETHEFVIAQVKLSEREVARNKRKRKESASAACRNSTSPGTSNAGAAAAAAGTHDDDFLNSFFSPDGVDAVKKFLSNSEWEELLGEIARSAD